MFTNTPSDRVQLVGRGDLRHPGCCAVCGSGNGEEGYVDLGVYYDYEGQMYLCWTCTAQVAEVIDCLLPSEAAILKELVEQTELRNKDLQTQLEAANERLRAFDVAFASVKFPDDPSASVASVVSEDSTVSVEVEPTATNGPPSREPIATKPVTVKRRSNVKRTELRNDATGDNGFEL